MENFTARAHQRNYSKPGRTVLQVQEMCLVVQGANVMPAELLLLSAGNHYVLVEATCDPRHSHRPQEPRPMARR